MNREILPRNTETRSTIGDRIKLIRASNKMTQKEFSASLGIAQGFLCAIERGKKNPSDTLLIAIQYRYKINRDWLHTGAGDRSTPQSTAFPSKEDRLIPLYKTPPSRIDDLSNAEIDQYISIPEAPGNCFAFIYNGDFMSPTLRDQDLIIINPQEEPASGEIVLVVGKWGHSFLRRYRQIGEETFFSADNSSYATFKEEKGANIIGVVDSVWRKIKY